MYFSRLFCSHLKHFHLIMGDDVL